MSKVGDRYYWKRSDRIWEVVSFIHSDRIECIAIQSDSVYNIGDKAIFSKEYWETTPEAIYLGNFSKSSNFKDIYDILNETNGASE
jgi:hypothetical protein